MKQTNCDIGQVRIALLQGGTARLPAWQQDMCIKYSTINGLTEKIITVHSSAGVTVFSITQHCFLSQSWEISMP